MIGGKLSLHNAVQHNVPIVLWIINANRGQNQQAKNSVFRCKLLVSILLYALQYKICAISTNCCRRWICNSESLSPFRIKCDTSIMDLKNMKPIYIPEIFDISVQQLIHPFLAYINKYVDQHSNSLCKFEHRVNPTQEWHQLFSKWHHQHYYDAYIILSPTTL